MNDFKQLLFAVLPYKIYDLYNTICTNVLTCSFTELYFSSKVHYNKYRIAGVQELLCMLHTSSVKASFFLHIEKIAVRGILNKIPNSVCNHLVS